VMAIIVTFLLSLGGVAAILFLSHKKAWYDQVDERKIHTGDVPRLGGIGFALAFILVTLWITLSSPEPYFGLRFLPPLGAMVVILVFGVIDDFRPLSPFSKLCIQILASACALAPDHTFHRLFFVDLGGLGDLSWVRYPLSFLWLVGMTNAVNLIDGVDGLAGGLSALIALTYALIFSFLSGSGETSLLCLCLAAAVGGFLVFNLPLPRARIFMGDGGAYFLGFALALLPLVSGGGDGGGGVKTLPMFYAGALALIPVYDTAAAIWRRVRDHRPIDSPDRAHLHHKLMNLGLSARQIDLTLYGLQAVLSGLTLAALAVGGGAASLALLVSAYLLCLVFFTGVHYLNKLALARFSIPTPTDGARP